MASTGKKWLIGCGVGCLALLVLGIGSCVGFMVWIGRPGDLLEPNKLLGPTTTGYVEWTLSDEDPGTRQFAEGLIALAQKEPAAFRGLPPLITRMITSRQEKDARKKLDDLLPTVAVWTLQPSSDGSGDLHLWSVSLESAGNRMTFADWILRVSLRNNPEVTTTAHNDEHIYTLPIEGRSFSLFIYDQDIFVTTGLENARQAVDLLGGKAPDAARLSPVARRFEELPAGSMRGVVDNGNGELRRVWGQLAGGSAKVGDELWEGVRGAAITAGFSGPTAFSGTLDLDVADAGWAAAHAGELLAMLRSGPRAVLPEASTATAMDDRVRIAFVVTDVADLLEHLDIE